jgi:membrane-bound serine protease (ClpP class)
MVAGAYFTVKYMPTRSLGGLVLMDHLARVSREEEATETQAALPSLVGATGIVLTDLHPAGAVRIDGERVDVVAEEGYIPRGATVEVILDQGYRRVVRMLEAPPQQERKADESDSSS